MAFNKDSKAYTIIAALAICLVGSIMVSTAAVVLKPLQQTNRLLDKQINILRVAGLYQPGMDVAAAFRQIEPKLVDYATGEYVTDRDPLTYDQYKAAKEGELRVALSKSEDIAGINARARYGTVYLVKNEDGSVRSYVLPIHGYGLWSTLYGFLALEADGNTVRGINFYQHAETPGLGGEVDNPKWKAQWEGKQVYDEQGRVALGLVKGSAGADDVHGVDALAGATLTSNGVSNLVKFWMSEQGYKAYLDKMARG